MLCVGGGYMNGVWVVGEHDYMLRCVGLLIV